MKDGNDMNEHGPAETPNGATTAVSLFGADASENEFPVLKAFQQYIDAEQAKARRRMLGLSVFFIALLVVVIVTFTLVMVSLLDRGQAQQNELLAKNQALQDRMLEIALRDRAVALPAAAPAAPVAVPAPVAPAVESDELKAMRESVAALAAAVAADREAAKKRPAPSAADDEARVREAAEKVRAEREELRRQRELLKAEQEKAHQEEVERHRRRLYPEYYAKLDAARAAEDAAATPAPASTVNRPAPIDYFSAYEDDEAEEDEGVPAQKKKARIPAPSTKKTKKKAAPAKPTAAKTETLDAGGIPMTIGNLDD